MTNIINLFPHKQVNPEKLTNADIEKFLDVLDKSLDSFMELSPHEKFSLYRTLVEFTKTSMDVIMKREGEKV